MADLNHFETFDEKQESNYESELVSNTNFNRDMEDKCRRLSSTFPNGLWLVLAESYKI